MMRCLDVGVKSITLDITTPALIPKLVEEIGIATEIGPKLRAALDKKDSSAIQELAGNNAGLFTGLIEAAGSWDGSVTKLKALSLPKLVSPILIVWKRLQHLLQRKMIISRSLLIR